METFEPRLMLSGTAARKPGHAKAAKAAAGSMTSAPIAVLHRLSPQVSPDYAGSSSPFGKTPAVVRGAYGVPSLAFGSGNVAADGSGQTIAIIDAYDYPTAAADLNAFSTYYGLPTLIVNTNTSTINNASGPTFTKVSQTGSTTALPATDPSGPYKTTGGSDFELEEALDIEWAHVMAPRANLVLVECTSPSDPNLFTAGVNYARSLSGVVAVSMSFGGDEFASETSYDADFTTPSGHLGGSATAGGTQQAGGVTFLASAGDYGAYEPGTRTVSPQYPAASPNVVAVGGTTLNTSGSSYVVETAWGSNTSSGTSGGGGGGISKYEAVPTYQASTVAAFSTTKRAYPDLSILADPSTGVSIYDSYDYGSSTPWTPGLEGGTSLACPLMAGLVALADQDRAIYGLGSLDGKTATLPSIYSIAAADYHDVTGGNNGYAAGTGYDLATGRGSPVANKWVLDVANIPATSVVAGRAFRDANANGVYDGADAPLATLSVYLDANGDGVRQSAEPTTTTDANGTFSFTGLAAGATGVVRPLTVPAGYAVANAPTFTTGVNTTSTVALGLFPTAYADAANGDAYTVRVSPTSATTLQILVNGAVAYTAPASLAPSLSFAFTGAGDALAVDFGNGNPVPAGGLSVNGTAATNGDTFAVLGTAGNDAITVNAATVVFGSNTISYANVANLSVDPRGGTDALAVNARTVTVPAQPAGGGLLTRTFSSLSVAAGARLAVATAAARPDRTVLVAAAASALSVAAGGQLDVGGNDLVVRGGSLATVTALAATGSAGGVWTGPGLASAAAAADPRHVTALGVATGDDTGGTFDGLAVAAADVLVKYTYYGDADLSGTVDGVDYGRTDAGFASGTAAATPLTGWANGDFNYDAATDGSDYTLIDNAYNTQNGTL